MVEDEVRNTMLRGEIEREREIKPDNKDNTAITVWDRKNRLRFL